MTQQPEALLWANVLVSDIGTQLGNRKKAAAELQRLHVACERHQVEVHRLRNQRDIQADHITTLEAALRKTVEALHVAERVANCAYNTGQNSPQWASTIRPAIYEFDEIGPAAITAARNALGEKP